MIKIHIFALAAAGLGISGGDRIFIEFARYWAGKNLVTIYVWEEGLRMCQRLGLNLSSIKCQVSSMWPWKKFGFAINYLARIIEGIRLGLTLKIDNPQNTILYSASEFWMDSLPGLILKLRYPKITWAAAWYQTAPHPLVGFTEEEGNTRYRLKALVYWFIQFPIKPLIDKFADFVLVNNPKEKKVFKRLDNQGKAIVVLGAIDINKIENWIRRNGQGNLPKIYDAVFQGRFHPQKGVLELIDIWKLVVNKKTDAKLVMIGDGPLMKNIKYQISNFKLEKNIVLTGYLFDGEEKYKIFAQSKIVVHPAFYDSGGMASYEAMAFGLPCVGFNLQSFRSYYPKGMEKVSVGSLEAFATKILQLLSDQKLYNKVSKDAYQLVKDMTWERRASQILDRMLE